MGNERPMIVRCRVCGAREIDYLCDTPNEHSPTTRLSHFRCRECGSVFVRNEVTPAELGIAYSTIDAEKYYRESESENRRKMTAAIEYLGGRAARTSSILDIGTGNGLFIELLANAGFEDVSAHEIQGSDLSRIEGIASAIYQDHDYGTIPRENFDVVTLLDVMEHVIDPRFVIRTCFRVLKPGGFVYFHTPVVTRTDRLMHVLLGIPFLGKIGRIWQRGRTSIFHLENYTPASLRLLLETEGFGAIDIRVRNELSWPLSKYIRVYLLEKHGLPGWMAPVLTPLLYPVLATDLLNANKAIVCARKPEATT